jgi:hypothetical protein
MIQIPLPNKNYIEEISKISQKVDINSLSINVYDAQSVKKGTRILIGNPGIDQSSVHTISDVVKEKLYISPATKYSYPSDTSVQKIYWLYYIAEISYDKGSSWQPLSTGEITYSKGYIGINKVPYYPKTNPMDQAPKIRYKYYVPCNTGNNNIEDTEWFEGSSNPYLTTIVGNVDSTFIQVESLIKRCQLIYGDKNGNLDTDVWLFWFNDLLEKYHEIINRNRTDTDKRTYTVITTPKIGTYYLPFSPNRILSVRSPKNYRIALYEDCTNVLVYRDTILKQETNLEECYYPTDSGRFNEFKIPPTYSLSRDAIILDPVPVHEFTLIIDYTAPTHKFTYENTSIELETDHENFFVYYALYNQFSVKSDPRASWARDQFALAERTFRSYILQRPLNKGQSGDKPDSLSHNYSARFNTRGGGYR